MVTEMTTLGMDSCKQYYERRAFDAYLKDVKNDPDGFEAALERCKDVICANVFGLGDTDLSGVGVFTGYIIQFIVAFLIVLFIASVNYTVHTDFTSTLLKRPVFKRVYITVVRTLELFSSTSLFFSAAVLFAGLFLTIANDFDIGTDLGSLEYEIIWYLALAAITPLLCVLSLPAKSSFSIGTKALPIRKRPQFELWMSLVCWVMMFFITALSKSLKTYGRQERLEFLPDDSWELLGDVCFPNPTPEAPAAWNRTQANNGTLALTILISLIFIYKFLSAAHLISSLRSRNIRYLRTLDHHLVRIRKEIPEIAITLSLLLISTVTAVFCFYAISKIKEEQRNVTTLLRSGWGNSEEDGWGFGQLVAVLIWLPILMEFVYQFFCEKTRRLSLRPVEMYELEEEEG